MSPKGQPSASYKKTFGSAEAEVSTDPDEVIEAWSLGDRRLLLAGAAWVFGIGFSSFFGGIVVFSVDDAAAKVVGLLMIGAGPYPPLDWMWRLRKGRSNSRQDPG